MQRNIESKEEPTKKGSIIIYEITEQYNTDLEQEEILGDLDEGDGLSSVTGKIP
jgi:hypothetical protein